MSIQHVPAAIVTASIIFRVLVHTFYSLKAVFTYSV